MKYLILLMACVWGATIACAQTKEEADSLHQLGRAYLNEGKIAEGRELTKRAMDMRRSLFGEVNESYMASLNNYALAFCMEKDYAQAIKWQEKVMELCGKLKTPHPQEGMYITNMGRFHYLNGDQSKAVMYWEQALPKVEKHGELYEFLLNNLGLIYTNLGDTKAMERIMALSEEHNCHELAKECNEPQCMWERAQYYMSVEENVKAKECFLTLLAMPMTDEMKIKAYDSYAKFLFGLRDFVSAAEYKVSTAQIHQAQKGKSEEYALCMHAAGLYHFLGKQFVQAITCYQEVVDFYSMHDTSTACKNKAVCLKNMGNAYQALKEYGKAKACYQQVVAYYEAVDKDDPEYPKAILLMAKAEKFNEEYEASIARHKQAMQLFEDRNMMEEYADAATSLNFCYVYAKKTVEVDSKEEEVKAARNKKLDGIIQEETSHLELTRKYLGKLTYARSLAVIAGCYAMKGEYAHAVDYYRQYMQAVREAVRDEFRMQSETERMTTWREEADHMQDIRELLVTLPAGNEELKDDIATLAYDVELLSKGILLNSSVEFGKILSAKGDRELQEAYGQTKKNETEIKRLRANARTDADLEKILELMRQNRELQLLLYKKCAEFADFTNYISYHWKDVQRGMRMGDVAIEFAAVKTGIWGDENQMMALVLTPDMPMPVAVPVCPLAEAEAMETDNRLFESPGNRVWGALSAYLADKQRVFFSADGSFNRVGIEYLPYEGKSFSEQFEVYRLSSTKELCYRHAKAVPTKVVLFGDINYNDASAPEQKQSGKKRGTGDIEGVSDLSNTLREVNEIQEMMKKKKIKDVQKLRDVQASKAAFMRLADSGVNWLHIATHGVYHEAERATDDESMKHCALAFSGANLGDDGWMTAAEVADMNLRQCDLAVLSACETGLGKLGGDGVFGLQRGFKNAGVHTLLMSLKEVYDDSTADLMISFYKHLMNKSTKREALIKAQQDIRKNGFKDAKYWATFILLDAY